MGRVLAFLNNYRTMNQHQSVKCIKCMSHDMTIFDDYFSHVPFISHNVRPRLPHSCTAHVNIYAGDTFISSISLPVHS